MKKFCLFMLMIVLSTSCWANPQTETFLKVLLDNMDEMYQHHMGVELGKHVIAVNKYGAEAVYDVQTGKIVLDKNMGTYNKFPHKKGAEHFSLDTYPALLESLVNDSSHEYIRAWGKDVLVSLRRVCGTSPALFQKLQPNAFSQNPYQQFTKDVFEPFLNNNDIKQLVSENPCQPTAQKRTALAITEVLHPTNLAKHEFINRYKNLNKRYSQNKEENVQK